MTDAEKLIWRASRSNPDALSTVLTQMAADIDALGARNNALDMVMWSKTQTLLGKLDELESRIRDLEAKRGPGRPPKG
jgi:hypothetical protein